MSAYDEIKDLYNFEEDEQIELTTYKSTYNVDGELLNGYTVTHNNVLYFIHRLKQSDGSNRTMGNLWSVYSIDACKTVRSGCKTKKHAIEEIRCL